jgi:hypothetical protein
MAKIKTKNQPNPPSKDKGVLRKVIFKGKDATIVLFKDIDIVNASVRINVLKNLYHDWRGEFIITR